MKVISFITLVILNKGDFMHRIEKVECEVNNTEYGLHVNGSRVPFYTSTKNIILEAMEELQVSELVFSDEEIPGGNVLYSEGIIDGGSVLYSYGFDSNEKTIHLCKDKLRLIFGRVPKMIWWKQVK